MVLATRGLANVWTFQAMFPLRPTRISRGRTPAKMSIAEVCGFSASLTYVRCGGTCQELLEDITADGITFKGAEAKTITLCYTPACGEKEKALPAASDNPTPVPYTSCTTTTTKGVPILHSIWLRGKTGIHRYWRINSGIVCSRLIPIYPPWGYTAFFTLPLPAPTKATLASSLTWTPITHGGRGGIFLTHAFSSEA